MHLLHTLTPKAVNSLSGGTALIAEMARTGQAVTGSVLQIRVLPDFVIIDT
jgi:hypothetical protein